MLSACRLPRGPCFLFHSCFFLELRVQVKCVGIPAGGMRPGTCRSSAASAISSRVALAGVSPRCAPEPAQALGAPGLWPVSAGPQPSCPCARLLGSAFPLVLFAVRPSESGGPPCPAPRASSVSPTGLWRLCVPCREEQRARPVPGPLGPQRSLGSHRGVWGLAPSQ